MLLVDQEDHVPLNLSKMKADYTYKGKTTVPTLGIAQIRNNIHSEICLSDDISERNMQKKSIGGEYHE